ncbi:uncharacterized protein isoform X2 [Rhodnius prolixus]|uniref:uncharacterized protein isoform X2 n=1 Tax=Rhodnius prolixus TaxID=13249 RepID=UPI003D188FDD
MNEQNSNSKNPGSSLEITSARSRLLAEDEGRSSNQSFPDEIDEYLKKVSLDVSSNLKLQKEHQSLTDLLASYKRLSKRIQRESLQQSNKIDKSTSEIVHGKSKQIKPALPEIYAALRPDLYKDVREEEKKRFITNLAKKRFYTQAEKNLPPHTISPIYILQDKRQNEKDRFCKLVSSAASNPVGVVTKTSKSLKTFKNPSFSVENIREKEKDRLAKIFASSPLIFTKTGRKPIQSAQLVETLGDTTDDGTLMLQRTQREGADMCKSPCNQENINPQTGISKSMVRVGEYSPLNGNHRGKTTLGIGEHEEQRKQLTEERRKEYKHLMATSQKLTKDFEKASVRRVEDFPPRPRMSSASTQTDSEDSSNSFQETSLEEFDTPENSLTSSPRRRRRMDFSPREKLLSDLYGSKPTSNYEAFLDEKMKQAAYARELRKQIEEKNRLEEERKLREKQEEELIEKRAQEQAERLRLEYVKEQNKKYDWMQQRKIQDETLRKRLLELELESKELKKQERQKKLLQTEESENRTTRSRKVSQKRFPSQSPNNLISTRNRIEFPTSVGSFLRSPVLDVAPLLDADRQNVLPAKASELRRGYSESDEAAALALGPGVNLLSSNYVSNDEIMGSTEERLSLKSVIKEEKSNFPRERYVPSIGHTSQRSVNHQQSSSGSSLGQEQAEVAGLLNSPDNHFVPSNWVCSNQNETNRPPSPVIPALQTDMLLKRNSKLFDEKWKVPTCPVNGMSKSEEIERSNKQESSQRSILTQLGEFRRKLALEHQLLEQRLKKNDF